MGLLMTNASFDPWVNIGSAEQSTFEGRLKDLFATHLARKKESSYQHLHDASRRGQKSRSVSNAESSTVTCSGRASSTFFVMRLLEPQTVPIKQEESTFKFSVVVETEET